MICILCTDVPAQGLASGQRVCVVDPRADSFLAECMWMPGSNVPLPTSSTAALSTVADDEDDERASEHDTKIKIAWRYEQMKQFQTTVNEQYARSRPARVAR